MTDQPMIISVSLSLGKDVGKEETEHLARQLVRELMEFDAIESAEFLKIDDLPEGAKGIPIDFGTILVKIAEVEGITGLISAMINWLARDKSRALKLQLGDNCLEVTGISKTEQKELIEWFKGQSSYNWTANIA